MLLALGACETLLPTSPVPSEGLMQDCPQPWLVPDPETQDSEQINSERISVAQWGKCNQTKFRTLRTYVRASSPRP
jgi:hypothetical protein